MVDISSFRRDAAAMRDGEWVDPGPEFGGMRLKCRFLGYQYLDAVAAQTRALARQLGGEGLISSEQRSRINVDAMIETGLIDVEGLSEGGQAVTIERFVALLRDPNYREMVSLCFECCSRVGRQRQAAMEEAAGNWSAASATT